MKVAVITPFFKTPHDLLATCIQSVAEQSHPCVHVIVSDGDYEFPGDLRRPELQFIQLPASSRDFGDTPRAIGTIFAFQQGFDAVTWLDSDNWYLANHVESLVRLYSANPKSICVSGRVLCAMDGAEMGPCPETVSGNLIDTNTYFVPAEWKGIANVWWTMSPDLHAIGDRVLLSYLVEHKIPVVRSGLPTVCYRTNYKTHYEYFGLPVPPDTRDKHRFRKRTGSNG